MGMRRSVIGAMLTLCFSAGVAKADCAELGNDIKSLVCPLPASYDPDAQNYMPPACAGVSPDIHKDALQGAFMLAPRSVKEEICRLKQIFILDGGEVSWGLWENPVREQTPGGKKPDSY